MMHLFPFSYSSSPPVCTYVPSLVQDGNLISSPMFTTLSFYRFPGEAAGFTAAALPDIHHCHFSKKAVFLATVIKCLLMEECWVSVSNSEQTKSVVNTLYVKCHKITLLVLCK